MKTKEQKVKTYSNLFYAKKNIEREFEDGWYVHTCTFCNVGNVSDGILVVYERDLTDSELRG